jgi:hypothetical protein
MKHFFVIGRIPEKDNHVAVFRADSYESAVEQFTRWIYELYELEMPGDGDDEVIYLEGAACSDGPLEVWDADGDKLVDDEEEHPDPVSAPEDQPEGQ